MEAIAERENNIFRRGIDELADSSSLTKQEKAMKLVSKMERLVVSREGIETLYKISGELDSAGIFEGTNWETPSTLVPSLVRGTLLAGPPTSTMEVISELRLLAVSLGEYQMSGFTKEQATSFLEDVLVQNLDFALGTLREEARARLRSREVKKVFALFTYMMDHLPLNGIKERLSEEIKMICAQRPVETRKTKDLIKLIKDRIDISSGSESDRELQFFVDAVFHPSPFSEKYPDPKTYASEIKKLSHTDIIKECKTMGQAMEQTGLVSPCHLPLLAHVIGSEDERELVGDCLALSPAGRAEWETHREWLLKFSKEVAMTHSPQSIYGLSRLLNKTLLSRKAVLAGLNNMRGIKVHPVVGRQIIKSLDDSAQNEEPLPHLLSGIVRILGQPLGVGQGNNPTCQSARGISLWSRHAPAKLIDMVITVATQNKLIMRFENSELNSNKLGKGLVDKLDMELDVVSAVLVPHLDKIYNEMMRLASGRGEDPHKWVNPSLYGHWIQVGFASAYNYLSNSIMDYEGFTRLYYSSFHPEYNGGKQMTYPCPIGIFITSAQGEMLGFHAISLLRIGENEEGEMRAYFLNPNNEGRQNWGQEIRPTVFGNGEEAGESSLPFHELASRIYAFHFHPVDHVRGVRKVQAAEINRVRQLASESWGKKYIWSDIPKIW